MIITKVENIDIVKDVLIRPEALNSYLGQEVDQYLTQKLKETAAATLFNINLRKANPIDYSFSREAFGNFFKEILKSENLDVIFYLNKSQVKSLFWGLLESQNAKLAGAGDFMEDFKTHSSIKISLEDRILQFVSIMSEKDLQILEYINNKETIADKDLYDYFTAKGMPTDDVVDSVRTLKSKKFIYSDEIAFPKIIISVTYQRNSNEANN